MSPFPVSLSGRLKAPFELSYFTLLIHLRMGPVTLVSAVSGDITSEMWL